MSFEILSAAQFEQITGKKRKSAQVAWFEENFNVQAVRRVDGSLVMTQEVFEALLAKRMGLAPKVTPHPPIERPILRPVFPDRAVSVKRRSS